MITEQPEPSSSIIQPLTKRVRGELPLRDQRNFSLMFYAHGHTQVLVRGYPTTDGESEDLGFGPVLDLLFTNVWRVSCWKEWRSMALRIATAEERAVLAQRIGEIRPSGKVYLLSDDSLEDYIIASRVTWAEHYLTNSSVGPLWKRIPGTPQEVPVLGDVIYSD